MESNWASEHLQVIRTLMERSAIYRRALGPIMFLLGTLGLAAGGLGWVLQITSTWGYAGFWMSVGVVGVSGAFVMVRRQALKDGEVFWSPPTRRVTQALMPPLSVGVVATVLGLSAGGNEGGMICWLPPLWMALYGCALHAAGFFTPRGTKLFGWIFILGGAILAAALSTITTLPSARSSHLLMGLSFGGLHLAYGFYLHLTESRKNET